LTAMTAEEEGKGSAERRVVGDDGDEVEAVGEA